MNARSLRGRSITAALCMSAWLFGVFAPPAAAAPNALKHGAYIFAAAGCAACHTDVKNKGPVLAGGRALKTPFGTFYGPNITPDPEHGIGRWTDADFIRALRQGISPSGEHYFPAFPYPAFTQMTDADMRALKAYIFTLPAVARPSRPHDVPAPFRWRFLLTFWKWLFFTSGPYLPDPARDARWNRGAYLVRALVHCGECHTQRNVLGGLKHDEWLAGNDDGPDRDEVPNITSDPKIGIGRWSAEEIAVYLEEGLDPTGDYAGAAMAEVIENSTGRLTARDRDAIVAYLRTVKPIRTPPPKTGGGGR